MQAICNFNAYMFSEKNDISLTVVQEDLQVIMSPVMKAFTACIILESI
jgi:hypothetical protein